MFGDSFCTGTSRNGRSFRQGCCGPDDDKPAVIDKRQSDDNRIKEILKTQSAANNTTLNDSRTFQHVLHNGDSGLMPRIGPAPLIEKRLSHCESMVNNLQSYLFEYINEAKSLRTVMHEAHSESKTFAQNASSLGDKLRQEIALQREHLLKEMATLEIRLAVSEETVKKVETQTAAIADEQNKFNCSLLDHRLQEVEHSNGNVLKRLDHITESQRREVVYNYDDDKHVNSSCNGTTLPSAKSLDGENSSMAFAGKGPESEDATKQEKLSIAWMETVLEKYEFEESIWDLALFVGMPRLGNVGTLWIYIVFFFNIIVQVALCLIIHDAFTIPTVDQGLLDELRLWRISTAHDFKWMDDLTQRTLAKRLCDGSSVPPISSSIAELLSMIDGYQTDNIPRGTHPFLGTWFIFSQNVGMCMTCLAVIIWWLEVLREISDTLDLAMATFALPLGQDTLIRETHRGLLLERIDCRRRLIFYMVVVVKLLVASLLHVTGTCYLIFTIDISDLLLNAAALAIVFNVDEMMYTALSPRLAKKLVRDMVPLDRPRASSFGGLDYRPLAKMAFIVIGLISVVVFHLVPQTNQLVDARNEICAGNIDFVAIVDAYGAVLARDVSTHTNDATQTYRFKAMRELVTDHGAAMQRMSTATESYSWSATALGVYGASYSIKHQDKLSVAENLDYWVTDCQDMPSESDCGLSEQSCWRLLVLQAEDASVKSCVDAAKYCGVDTLLGIRTRQYCPHTCGCNDPTFPNMFFFPSQGCGSTCENTAVYRNWMASRDCVDDEVGSPTFGRYLQGLEDALTTYRGTSWESIANPVRDVIAAHGCHKSITMADGGGYIVNMCSEFNILSWKPLSFLCPLTCGCPNYTQPMCPLKCSSLQKAIHGGPSPLEE